MTLEPTIDREFYTDSPLAGLALAREGDTLLAWDTGHVLYLLDPNGQLITRLASREAIAGAAISDNGQRIVLATRDGRIAWFDAKLGPLENRRLAVDPLAVAVDGHGRYAAVSVEHGENLIVDCYSQKRAGFSSSRPVTYMHFVAGQPALLAAAEAGWLAAFGLDGKVVWTADLGSKLGGVTATVAGNMLLVPAFTHGLLRLGGDGTNQGTYRVENIPIRAAVTASGDRILAGTLEKNLALLDRHGLVLWIREMEAPLIDVALGPFGREAWFGLQTGRIARFNLQPEANPVGQIAAPSQIKAGIPKPLRDSEGVMPKALRDSEGVMPKAVAETKGRESKLLAEPQAQHPLREPLWSVRLKKMADQLATAGLAVVAQPLRIGVFLSDGRLRVYPVAPRSGGDDTLVEPMHTSQPLPGIGRIVRGNGRHLIALTDRRVLCYDAASNQSQIIDARFAQVTHCETLGQGELILVQERDRLTRAAINGRIAWLKVLTDPIEHLAVHAQAVVCTTDSGRILIFDLEGKQLASLPAVDGQTRLLTLQGDQVLTVGRVEKRLRACRLDGSPLWDIAIPFEPWRLQTAGRFVIVRSHEGTTLAVDPAGGIAAGGQPVLPDAWYFNLPDGRVGRMFAEAGSLTCADFAGRLLWRHVADGELGPLQTSTAGVAVILGNRLCWFPWAGAE